MGVYYKSNVPVIFMCTGGLAAGTWSYWTGSPTFPAVELAAWRRGWHLRSGDRHGDELRDDLNGIGQVSTSNYSLVDIGSGPPPPAPIGVNALVNPTLTLADGTNANPYCWTKAGYGTNAPTFAWSKTGGQPAAGAITMRSWGSGDAKLIPTMDGGNCAPTVTPATATR